MPAPPIELPVFPESAPPEPEPFVAPVVTMPEVTVPRVPPELGSAEPVVVVPFPDSVPAASEPGELFAEPPQAAAIANQHATVNGRANSSKRCRGMIL